MLLAAPNIVSFPDIVLADASIIHWLMWASPAPPIFVTVARTLKQGSTYTNKDRTCCIEFPIKRILLRR
jgi:hypothetical protein